MVKFMIRNCFVFFSKYDFTSISAQPHSALRKFIAITTEDRSIERRIELPEYFSENKDYCTGTSIIGAGARLDGIYYSLAVHGSRACH